MITKVEITTRSRSEMIDITREVVKVVANSGITEGICCIYSPHTTCGITINENADPDVKRDFLLSLDELIPWDHSPKNHRYTHVEGNSAAHLKSSMMGFSAQLPVSEGNVLLGTWQGIYLCEFDGPRRRKVMIQTIG